MTFAIPGWLNEAVNGALVAMLAVTSSVLALALLRAWRDMMPGMKFRDLYTYENKATIALLTLSAGLMLKVGTEWWWFHLKNKGMSPNYPLLLPAFLLGSGMSVWGLICLVRAISRYDWPQWRWVWLAIGAVAFGIVFAI